MKFIDDLDNPGKFIDENFEIIPPDIGEVIANTVQEYLDKYEDAEYMTRESFINMHNWKRWLSAYEDMSDAIL